jgi:hypothetical protein
MLDPADVGAFNGLARDHVFLGHFDKALDI